MWIDPSATHWAYHQWQIGGEATRLWLGMPQKQQAVNWLNVASGMFVKWGVYNPGANPPAESTGAGQFFPSPDQDYTIVQNFTLGNSVLITALPTTANINFLASSLTKPHSDSIDPDYPP